MNTNQPNPGPTIYLSTDPRSGAGYNADAGTVAVIAASGLMLIKISSHANDWQEVGGGSVGGSNNTYDSLVYNWADDWFLQAQLAQGNGWNAIPIGALPYSLVLVGANTAITQVTGSQRLGVVSLDTGTTAGGIAAVNTEATLAYDSGTFDEISFDYVGGIQTLDDGADRFNVTIGLVGNAPGYGVYFLYDPANTNGLNAGLSANWLCVTMEAGVSTVIDSGIAPGAVVMPNTNVARLKCLYQSPSRAGTVAPVAKFYINGVLVGTQTATLPSHSLAGAVFINK